MARKTEDVAARSSVALARLGDCGVLVLVWTIVSGPSVARFRERVFNRRVLVSRCITVTIHARGLNTITWAGERGVKRVLYAFVVLPAVAMLWRISPSYSLSLSLPARPPAALSKSDAVKVLSRAPNLTPYSQGIHHGNITNTVQRAARISRRRCH